jgi:hypothetical protein
MKKLYTLSLLVILSQFTAVANDPNPEKLYVGYVITLDGKRLTGQIGDIFYSNIISNVVFVNDFGTSYKFRAEIIGGFVFIKENQLIEYQSIYQDESRTWAYLKVIERGEFLTLYKAPEQKTKYLVEVASGSELQTQTYNIEEYWLQFEGDKAFRIGRLGFKKVLKRKMRRYPSLVAQLENTELKFKDLAEIVRQVNLIHNQQKRTI